MHKNNLVLEKFVSRHLQNIFVLNSRMENYLHLVYALTNKEYLYSIFIAARHLLNLKGKKSPLAYFQGYHQLYKDVFPVQ